MATDNNGKEQAGLIEKPTPPAASECCESSCSPCVWDRYYDELKRWREQQQADTKPDSSS